MSHSMGNSILCLKVKYFCEIEKLAFSFEVKKKLYFVCSNALISQSSSMLSIAINLLKPKSN